MNDIKKICDYYEANIVYDNIQLGSEFYYSNVPCCIIDAVFSISAKYTSTQKVVSNYCYYFSIDRIRSSEKFPAISEQHTVSEMIGNIKSLGLDKFTEICDNRQRTSTRNGILKSKAVLLWAEVLANYGIDTFQDLENMYSDEVEKELEKIPGQTLNASIPYFKMLCGNINMAKPDRHILHFLSLCLEKNVSPKEAQYLLSESTELLAKKHSGMNVRSLDYSIWSYMSSQKSK